jgi:short-subunit dehydrogenase
VFVSHESSLVVASYDLAVRIEPGTRAIVTGATRGIGRATATALARRGARVGVIARGVEGVDALAAELGAGAVALHADVTDREAIAGAIGSFIDETGGLELAVANAGLAHYGPFADQPIEHAEEMVRLNVLGTIYTVHAALEPMLARAVGQIVVVSSGAGLRAFPWGAVYGATKAADKGFAEALRHELSGTGVSVSTVLPGEVETSLHDHQPDKVPDWRRSDDAISPDAVADAVIRAAEEDRREVHVPPAVRLLALNDLAPRLIDRLLARARGPTAAPRRD